MAGSSGGRKSLFSRRLKPWQKKRKLKDLEKRFSMMLQDIGELGEQEGGGDLQGTEVKFLILPDPNLDNSTFGSKSGSSLGSKSSQGSISVSDGDLLCSTDFEEGKEEEEEEDRVVGDDGEEQKMDEEEEEEEKMNDEELQEWWETYEVSRHERPESPGWGYSDVDENDPQWRGKLIEKFRRQRPPKYQAILDRDYCPPGVREKDQALWDRYLKQIEDSDGYDITEYPGPTLMTPITPLFGFKQSPSTFDGISKLTDEAIKKFNKGREEDDQYEVHDILTANVRGGMTSTYYITFEAKKKQNIAAEEDDQGGAPLLTTFQARVRKTYSTGEVEVKECRIKGLKPPQV